MMNILHSLSLGAICGMRIHRMESVPSFLLLLRLWRMGIWKEDNNYLTFVNMCVDGMGNVKVRIEN